MTCCCLFIIGPQTERNVIVQKQVNFHIKHIQQQFPFSVTASDNFTVQLVTGTQTSQASKGTED